jgi:DNA-directed RNA polymerase subunit RPC12/RpoP
VAVHLWTFTCMHCGMTQAVRVDKDDTRVKCEHCNTPRNVPKEVRDPDSESDPQDEESTRVP